MAKHKYDLCYDSFKNATWYLTKKESKETIKYDYSKMSIAVTEAYLSYYNSLDGISRSTEKQIAESNVNIRCLHQNMAWIGQIEQSMVVAIGYSQILPEYTFDCYDYHYQCPKCQWVFDEIARQGQKRNDELYCRICREFV